MSQPYKLANDLNGVLRTDVVVRVNDDSTQSWIPNDDKNPDWRDYQDWLLAGNTPDPAT